MGLHTPFSLRAAAGVKRHPAKLRRNAHFRGALPPKSIRRRLDAHPLGPRRRAPVPLDGVSALIPTPLGRCYTSRVACCRVALHQHEGSKATGAALGPALFDIVSKRRPGSAGR